MINDTLPDRRQTTEAFLFGTALWLLGFTWMYRGWLFQHFDAVFGDEGDAQTLIMLLEHWYHVFTGQAADWLSPPIFYPEQRVLGFTDAYFLYGVEYSLLRALSLDPYLSFMGVMATLSVIGFVGFMRLAIVDFHISGRHAAIGAFLFAFANMMTLKFGHAQSYCAMLLPLVAHLAATGFKTPGKYSSILCAGSAGLLMGLIFFTAYLTAWFFTTFVLLVALTFVFLSGWTETRKWLHTLRTAKRRPAIALGLGFAIGLIPFVIVYLPMLLQGRARSRTDVTFYAPRFRDIVNLGNANWFWNSTLQALNLFPDYDRAGGEVRMGYTPGVIVVCVLFSAFAWRRWWRGDASWATRDTLVLAIAGSTLAYFLVQLNYFGIKPWYIILDLVPGARGVRTTFRSQIVLNLGTCIVVAAALDHIVRRGYGAWQAQLAAALLGLFLMLEQTNNPPGSFSRANQLAWQSRVPAPPEDCRSFYAVPRPAPAGAPWFQYQSDAMLVAVRWKIPTINGNSSWFPDGWNLLRPEADDYRQSIHTWATTRKITDGICGLDARNAHWTVGLP